MTQKVDLFDLLTEMNTDHKATLLLEEIAALFVEKVGSMSRSQFSLGCSKMNPFKKESLFIRLERQLPSLMKHMIDIESMHRLMYSVSPNSDLWRCDAILLLWEGHLRPVLKKDQVVAWVEALMYGDKDKIKEQCHRLMKHKPSPYRVLHYYGRCVFSCEKPESQWQTVINQLDSYWLDKISDALELHSYNSEMSLSDKRRYLIDAVNVNVNVAVQHKPF